MNIVWNTANLHHLLDSPDGEVGRMIARKCIAVEARAKALCPVNKDPRVVGGRLRSSITWEVGEGGGLSTQVEVGSAGGLVGVIGTNVEYALYVELGTRFQRAQPYLVPALEAAR